ncbi:hypothetical protein CW708_02500 [Candidatus Bathyarchaeota archaeon]|nr:MAG: hypothetical protein CW708_02500 [Candidatus Bathyarchaeota archaeon]
MRVYFSPCGIGLGHVGRCIPIARRLMEKKAKVLFSTYREGLSYVERERIPFVESPSIGFQVKPDGTIDFKQTTINPGPFLASFTLMEQINAELRFIESFNPHVVVSDSRASPLFAAKMLGIPRICILNQFQVIVPRKKRFLKLARLADFIALALIGKMWTMGNHILIPDFPEPYTISSGNLHIPKSYRKLVKLIGPIIPKRPEELPTKMELRRKLGLPLDKPVIFAPLSGPVRERAFLTGILRKIFLKFPSDYEVVMSLGYPNTDNKPINHGNFTTYKWIPNRFEYLKACDLLISRAGHGTITQCMYYGKPMILIPTPSHTEQINNAKKTMDLGVARIIQQEKLTKAKLLKNVKLMLQSKVQERITQIQEEVLKYDGLKRAVETIIKVAENQN